jgi:hypothetical protein
MKTKEKTIKNLENIKRRAEKMVEKENGICFCEVCKKPVAKWVLSPDGEGSYQSSIKDISSNRAFWDNGIIKFFCKDCLYNLKPEDKI